MHSEGYSYLTVANFLAVKTKNAVVISVDHASSPPGIKHLGIVQSKHSIFIGGHPALHEGKTLKGSESMSQYVGCIKNLIIKEKSYSLDPARIHGKVLADVCPTI